MTSSPPDAPGWARFADSERPPLEVHEAVLEVPGGRRLTLAAASEEAIVSTAAQMDAYAEHLRPVDPGETPDDQALFATVEYGVQELQELLQGHDALDVMTMLRQYLMPPDLAFWAESGTTVRDSWASAEVVALVLLGLGLPSRDPACDVRTASIIPSLVENSAALVHLAALSGVLRWSKRNALNVDRSGLNMLAWRLSSHESSVRGRQYSQVANAINDAVLRTTQTDRAFREVLRFTYDDVLAVRAALIEHTGSAFEDALAQLRSAAGSGGPPAASAIAAARAFFETPSQLHLAQAQQLAQHAGLGLDVVIAVLDRFSVRPDERTPNEMVRAFCDGRNPMEGRTILHAPGRGYLPLPGAIALDEIRRTCEGPIKNSPAWTRYGRARDRAVEALVTDTVAAILHDRAEVHRNLRYRDSSNADDLSGASTTHQSAPLTEADALVLLDGVALCVEAKAGDLRPRTRQGGVAQLDGDLNKTIREAAGQADRLRQLIEHNRGLWLENGTWLALDGIQEIHSIVACLDDLGPLALSTSELVQAGVLPQTYLPWVVSIHDLLVTEHVLDRPEHFLTYLRRRTNRDAALWVVGSDELDILMWYVAGGFYFIPDPDRLYAQHPKSKAPTAKMRREYADQGRTVVGTFTDPLDANYYWDNGSSSQPADCPRRARMHPILAALVDSMSSNNVPGWWRLAADLDGYSTQAQLSLANSVNLTLARSARDGGFHTITTGGTDDTGRWIYIFAAGPDNATNREHLRQYLRAKKHQDHADRGLAALLKPDGTPHLTIWLAHKPEDDPELDALAREMRLIPPDRAPSAIPPKAKRAAARRPRSHR